MKNLKFKSLFLALSIASVSFISCDDDDEKTIPLIENGTSVAIRNTFQGDAQTKGEEVKIEDFFKQPAGSLEATATVAEAVEFPEYLLDLYDIDIDTNSITYTLVAPVDSATYKDFFRTIEEGSTDRYYLTFDKAHNVKSFTSDNASVNLRIDSDKVLVVEIGEGFNFNPGTTFTINLK